MNTILLVRGKDVSDGIGGVLERENFIQIRVKDVGRGFDEAIAQKPNLVLVDLPLEGASSQEVFDRTTNTRTPMIVLSSVSDEEEKSRALDQGADDYLVKPFSPRELLARIRAILRRTSRRHETICFDDVEINLERRTVTRGGSEVRFSRAEYKLLVFFIQNPDRPLTRDEILETVWGYQSMSTRTLDMHVARLRGKLERHANSPHHILTVHGVGYRFTLKVSSEVVA